jgi:hypothetical protein
VARSEAEQQGDRETGDAFGGKVESAAGLTEVFGQSPYQSVSAVKYTVGSSETCGRPSFPPFPGRKAGA